MEKIGIFGGTFNPIHKGHIHLIEACCGAFSFDRVLLIPTGVPPHKLAPDLAICPQQGPVPAQIPA